jgi:hypothetical protein
MTTNYGGQAYLTNLAPTIIEYAEKCKSFTKEQAYLMLPEKHFSTIDKVLAGLKTQRRLFLKGERYYVANPKADPDYTMINCLWVLLDMKGESYPNTADFWLGDAIKPSYISYVKNGIQYDIIPVDRGSEASISFFDRQYVSEVTDFPDTKHKYILVVPNEDILEYLPTMKAPHLYAVVNELNYSDMDYEAKKLCEVEYYQG